MKNPVFSLLSIIVSCIFPRFVYINNIILYLFYFLLILRYGVGFHVFMIPMELFVLLFFISNHTHNYNIQNLFNEKSEILNVFGALPIAIGIFDAKDYCVYCNSTLEDFYNRKIVSYTDLLCSHKEILLFLSKKPLNTKEFLIDDRTIKVTTTSFSKYFIVIITDITHSESKLHLYNSLINLFNFINIPLEIKKNKLSVLSNNALNTIDKTNYTKRLLKEEREMSFWQYDPINNIDELCNIAPIGIIVIDNHLNVKQINQHMQQIVKKTSIKLDSFLEEKDQSAFLDYVKGFICGSIKTSANFALQNGLPVIVRMKKYRDGFAIFVVYDPLLVSMDINYNHQQRLHLLGETASCISHDFNNIITSILGFCDISLEECNDNTNLYKNLIHIKHHSSRAANLVRQILNMSKKNTTELQVLKVKYAINEFLATLGRVFVHNLDIEQKANIREDVAIEMSLINFEQILFNLIKNSKDSIASDRQGKITIKLNLYESHKTTSEDNFIIYVGQYVEITVEDNGVGMSSGTLSTVFQPYFTTKKKGSGLGLYNVFNIVHRNRGFIRVDSKKDVGTTMKIYLPLCKKIQHETSNTTSDSIIQNKILFVEDEQAIRFFTTKGLRELGYNIDEAETPQQAKKKSKINHYDILVTDVNLPEISGIQLYKDLLQENKNLKVIFISGYDMETLKKQHDIKSEDAFTLVHKPFYINDIHSALRSIIKT